MRCYICDEQAEKVESSRDADLVDCGACGSYSISGSALAEMRANVFVFNTQRARDWLQAERVAGQQRPMIHSQLGLWG
jgi:hypothetical protein